MKLGILVRMFLVVIIFASCSDSSEILQPGDNSYFSLTFDQDTYEDNSIVYAYFMTTNLSEIPTVNINGENLARFGVYEGSIQGSMELEFSNQYSFNISSNGKNTSGSITMPNEPTNVMCNSVLLTNQGTNSFPYADSFNFSWNGNNYDYFYCYWNTNNYSLEQYAYPTETNTTFSPRNSDINQYYFYIRAANGVRPISGSSPNVRGEYGAGYVIASSLGKSYQITITN